MPVQSPEKNPGAKRRDISLPKKVRGGHIRNNKTVYARTEPREKSRSEAEGYFSAQKGEGRAYTELKIGGQNENSVRFGRDVKKH